MKYVVVRNDGWFVADMRKNPTGSSYTRNILYARVYDSKREAERDCCGNESVVPLSSFGF